MIKVIILLIHITFDLMEYFHLYIQNHHPLLTMTGHFSLLITVYFFILHLILFNHFLDQFLAIHFSIPFKVYVFFLQSIFFNHFHDQV